MKLKFNLLIALLMMSCVPLFAQTWTMISPKVTNQERRSIQMVNDSIGYSGGYGMPLKTTNGGATWFYPNNRADITSVTYNWFATPDSGWAIFQARQIWRSTNGGTTWDSLRSVSTFEAFKAIHFFNSSIGCAIGNAVSQGIAHWTSNGGNTWTTATTPSPLNDVQVIAPAIAVACAQNGKIYRTTNAGATWSEISTSALWLNKLRFVTASKGYAVGASGALQVTLDSGKTWSATSSGTTNELQDIIDIGSVVLVVGTRNIVQTLSGQSRTPFPNQFINYYAITAQVIDSVLTLFLAGEGGLILTSTNGGFSWQIRNSSPYSYQAIDFPTTSIGFIAGENGQIIKTTNGGTSWDTIQNTLTNKILDLKFTSSSIGYVLLQSTGIRDSLLKTTNGGTSWSVLPLPANCKGNRMFFLNDSLGFIAGSKFAVGAIHKTTNGGATWTSSSTLASRDVCFITPTVGFAVGYSGTTNYIEKSTDGGASWQSVRSSSSNPNEFLQRVVFFDTLTGYACGGNAVLKTTNGGTSWNGVGIATPTTPNLIDGFFLNAQIGVVLSSSNFYWKTTNGGTSWTQFQHAGSTTSTTRVYFLNMQKGFIVGRFGMIQKTDNAQLPVELSHFTAQPHREGILLNWTSQSELNNSGFSIERQRKNEAWLSIGFVRGHGTTSAPHSYSFIDKTASGVTRYRLKQLDFDGKFDYSPIVDINAGLPRLFSLEQNYPNPFNPTTVISYQLPVASDVKLDVFDVLGRKVMTLVNGRQDAGAYNYTLNAATLSSGIYFYQLQAGNRFRETKKMLLLR